MARVLQLAKPIVVQPIVEFAERKSLIAPRSWRFDRGAINDDCFTTSERIAIRTFDDASDIDRWLKLRGDSLEFLELNRKSLARAWDVKDFRREFLDKRWWHPSRMWLAEVIGEVPGIASSGSQTGRPTSKLSQRGHDLVGTVTLGARGSGRTAVPVVHWLLVSPRWRRRGLGTALMHRLELKCWELGHRDLYLETLSSWTGAVSFYEKLGFHPARNRSSP